MACREETLDPNKTPAQDAKYIRALRPLTYRPSGLQEMVSGNSFLFSHTPNDFHTIL